MLSSDITIKSLLHVQTCVDKQDWEYFQKIVHLPKGNGRWRNCFNAILMRLGGNTWKAVWQFSTQAQWTCTSLTTHCLTGPNHLNKAEIAFFVILPVRFLVQILFNRVTLNACSSSVLIRTQTEDQIEDGRNEKWETYWIRKAFVRYDN